MSNAALSFLVLLFCLGQFGCDQKQSAQTPTEQPTHDAAGYLIQPEQEFLVGGESRGWKHLFIQFDVNGPESNPFILNVGNEILPHDNWPKAPENKPESQTGSGFLFSHTEETPRPLEWFSLNSEDVDKLAEGVRKFFQWSDTAAKENLNVAGKVLVTLNKQEIDNITNLQGDILVGSTNGQALQVSFSKPKESSKSFIDVFVSEPLPYSTSLPSFCTITLDKVGVERLLTVITNLPSRRDKFIVFRNEQEQIVRQRNEARQNDKTRADALLH